MSSVALCALIKNEEKYLPYMLGSVQDLCEEKIIVDTGSKDRSIEIAKSFGCYVIQAPWPDDFAMIRNLSQSVVKSDWILWLDGDEVLDDAGVRTIKNELTETNQYDFWLFPRLNFWKDVNHYAWYPDSQYKLYRNNIGLKWKETIHEKIFDENNDEHTSRLGHTDIDVYHYAYMKSTLEVRKKMAQYIHIQNPHMNKEKIWACSDQHSFFTDAVPDFVQQYDKPQPEIFNKLDVTPYSISWKDGQLVIDFQQIKEIVEPLQIDKSKQTTIVERGLTSIIIVTHNKVEYLEPCINSIYAATHTPFEIVVVNNGSTEQNIMDFLNKCQKENSNLTIVNHTENTGFAIGYNSGIAASKGEFIFVLNNDTLLMEYSIEKMLDHLKRHTDFSIVAPVSNNIHGEHQMVEAPPNSEFGDYITIISNRSHKLLSSSWITGCAMLFHRSLIDELAEIKDPPRSGLFFCEDFPYGMGEDSDMCFMIQHKLNKKLGVAWDAFVWHWGQKTLESLDFDWRELQEKNNLILRKRWPEIFPEEKK